MTPRLLLGHLAGVRHYQGDEFFSTRHYERIRDTLGVFMDDPLLFEPGTKYSYTTYGYNLLGAAVEGASGMEFVNYVKTNIFLPAGMDHIRVDEIRAIIPHRAQGYFRTRDGALFNSDIADTSNKIPGGGFCSTVTDLAKFAIALQRGTLLRPETLELMYTAQQMLASPPSLSSYGLGWRVQIRDGVKEVTHGGGQQRIRTFLYMVPERRAAAALMCNLENAEVLEGLAREIAELCR